jgi:AAA domain (Cdc48 subfamily)
MLSTMERQWSCNPYGNRTSNTFDFQVVDCSLLPLLCVCMFLCVQGRTVDFRSTIIIMTSNLGSDIMYEMEEVSFATASIFT